MSSSLLIVVLVAVWLFVLAPMAIRARKPIRRAGDGLAQTRTLHAGGGRKLQPRRGRVTVAAEDEDLDTELFGMPSGEGSTDAELVEADSWLARIEEDHARHVADNRALRLRRAIDSREAAPTPERVVSAEEAPAAEPTSREQIASLARAEGSEPAAAPESDTEITAGRVTVGPNEVSAAERSRVEVTATFSSERAAKSAEEEAPESAPAAADLAAGPAQSAGAAPAEPHTETETFVVDGEVFDKNSEPVSAKEERPQSLRERHEAASAARAAARAADRPAEPELDDADYDFVERRRGRGVYDPRADREAAAGRAVRRQRTTLGLLAFVLLFAVLSLIVTPHLWAVTAIGAVLLGTYLWFLRKQVRMEQRLRARRIERLRRARLGVESRHDVELSVVPQRLRRPGSVVLEVDDEDPVFDHLESPRTAVAQEREFGGREGDRAQRSERVSRAASRRAV